MWVVPLPVSRSEASDEFEPTVVDKTIEDAAIRYVIKQELSSGARPMTRAVTQERPTYRAATD